MRQKTDVGFFGVVPMSAVKSKEIIKEKRISDSVLIGRFKKGSLDAFEELVTRYETKVFNLALRFTRCQEDAEEVLQDVFTTLFRKLEGFQGKAAFSSWLYRIVVNAAFMKLRKRKTGTMVYLDDLPGEKKNEDESLVFMRSDNIALNRELREVLQGAINKLPEQYRAVFVLRDVDALSNEEVAEVLNLSVPAVKSRLHRSRLMLRKRLYRYYEELYGKKVPQEALDENYVADTTEAYAAA